MNKRGGLKAWKSARGEAPLRFIKQPWSYNKPFHLRA